MQQRLHLATQHGDLMFGEDTWSFKVLITKLYLHFERNEKPRSPLIGQIWVANYTFVAITMNLQVVGPSRRNTEA